MKILHLSDLHGRHTGAVERLIDAHMPDWIVLTGDMLPDFHMISGKGNRLNCQREWWGTYRSSFMHPEAVTTLTLGNHEIEGFRDRELEAVPASLLGRVGVLQGNPAEFGAWGFSREYESDELQAEVDALNRPLVVLTHCPPHGRLDTNNGGQRIGHPPLRRFLDDSLEPPLLVLCGHVHESFGQLRLGRTLLVNAATGFALLDLDLVRGQAQVIEMSRMNSSTHEVL
jgi:Icc-related predicted phosphoesterase